MTRILTTLVVVAASACALRTHSDPIEDVDTSEADLGCPDIFLQGDFPEYRVTVSEEDWAALQDEFLNRAEREKQGLDIHPYHPIDLEFEGVPVSDAMIRLKGQSSWWQAIQLDANPKMQFVIAFNKINKDGRFHGLRKVELDMPRTDASFMRQRLGLYAMRVAGIPAPCANNARLTINGEYYGLYTHLERLDKEYLQRQFGDLDEGDLWKGGRIIETNEDTFHWDRLNRFWYPPNGLADIEEIVDLETSIREWAVEAMVPHGDGYYNGRANFYLYDHPSQGFMWLAHDLDSAFDFIPADSSPLFPDCEGRFFDDRIHWAMVLAKDKWLDTYIADLRQARAAYNPQDLSALVRIWDEQIGQAAADDPMKPFPTANYNAAIESLGAYPPKRALVVDEFLDCRDGGGDDKDGDGYDWCFDCDDSDAAINPDATEVCNGKDDNCDGQIDEPKGSCK